MAEYVERITTNGRNIDYKRPCSPVECQVEGAEKWVRKVNLFDSKYQPSNFAQADERSSDSRITPPAARAG